MKKLILILLFIFSYNLFAADSALTIEPLYGVERTQRVFPEPAKIVTRTFLGVRANYGVPLLSAELELTQSLDDEEFSDGMKVAYTTQRAMLGVRSYPYTSQYFGAYFRAGVRAQKTKHEITEDGEKRTEESDIEYDPYGGAGITIAFANNFALNAGATLVYNKHAVDGEQFDTQYTFGFTIRAGNR
jgi:hypothetical protein